VSDEVKLCMIGAGAHASSNIYPYFYLLRGARVVANADLDESKAARQARAHGIEKSYTDFHAMLGEVKPDGVIVCVGEAINETLVPELLEAGNNVYMEKPTATTLSAVRTMLDASRKAGTICMTAYKKRFATAYAKAKQIVTSAEFGDPVLLTLLRTKGYNPAKDKPDGEYLLRWGCHAIDLLPYYMGTAERVYVARTAGSNNAYAVSVHFASGAVGTLSITRCHGGCYEKLKVFGTKQRSVTIDNSINMVAYEKDQPFAAHTPSFTQGATRASREQGFLGELQEFADAIRDGRQPESNIEQNAHTMALYEAIQDSARARAPVDVEKI